MEMQSFYQVCIFFTVGLMVFTMSVNVMTGMDIFGNIEPTGGMVTGNDTNSSFEAFTGYGMNTELWILVLGGAVLLAVPIAIFTQSLSIVGVYIFGVFFWGSFFNALAIISIGSFMPIFLIPLFIVPVAFIFIGAVIGMLSGV